MDGVVQEKVSAYLKNEYALQPHQCQAVVKKLRSLAQAAGHALDEKFGQSGLSSGPEGRLAASIVQRATGGSGSATAEHDIRLVLNRWLRNSPNVGA